MFISNLLCHLTIYKNGLSSVYSHFHNKLLHYTPGHKRMHPNDQQSESSPTRLRSLVAEICM